MAETEEPNGSELLEADFLAVRARVLGESLAAGHVLLVGEGRVAKELMGALPDRFLADEAVGGADAGDPEPGGEVEVLALSLDPEVIARARAAAAAAGRTVFSALIEHHVREGAAPADPRAALRSLGLALVGYRRIFWPTPTVGGARTRAQRIDEETRELLVRVAPADAPGTASLLGEELERLERELAVGNELRAEQQVARATAEQRLHESREHARQLRIERERLQLEIGRLESELAQANERLREARKEAEAARDASRQRRVWRRIRMRRT